MIVAFGTGHTHGSFRVGKHKHATSLPRAKRDDLDYDVDDDDEFPAGMSYRSTSTAAAGGSQWAVQEADITMSPTARAAATARPVATNPGRWADEDDRDTGFDDRNSNSRDDRWQHDETDNGWSERAAGESRERERGAQSRNPRAYGDTSGYERNGDGGNFNGDTQNQNQTGGTPSWQNEDIIADSGQDWFENDEDWYEPEYGSVDAPAGSILEKVQRVHLREPKDYTFPDGEYFDLTGFVKDSTDNQFALVLEIAERARERKVEHLESLNPTPAALSLPPIQQAIVDLALEIEASGGKTSAYGAMREAADRARLRWELQEAAWAFDNYCEDRLTVLGVSERAARLLHMGIRVEDAMDFEKDLNQHEDDYNAKPGRNGL